MYVCVQIFFRGVSVIEKKMMVIEIKYLNVYGQIILLNLDKMIFVIKQFLFCYVGELQ